MLVRVKGRVLAASSRPRSDWTEQQLTLEEGGLSFQVELLRNYLDRLPAAKREGADAVIEVQDRGIGIPEADRGRLFEAFHRATNVGQVPGTGLGLLIVKRCVDLPQGSIGFESVVGEGTTFTVRLPLFSERG